MFIEIDNIELAFTGQDLLKGIYLKLETGKITAIIGKNGSGKSSLLNVLFGSLDPRHKLIRIDNQPFLKPLYTYKGLVRYLPQHSYIPKHLQMTTAFALFGVSWDAFVKDFKSMAAYKNAKINELSGGEKKIVETYLVILSSVDIILLDEPFTSLAPVSINKFKKILKREAKNKAVLITDHLYHHIIDLADDLYYLNNGCTQHIKDPAELENLQYISYGSL